jgi:hypothetical protein
VTTRAGTRGRDTAPVLLAAGPSSPAQTVEFAFGEADLLTALAARAKLLVLGPPADHGGDPSPATILVTTAPCPVVVVPSPCPDRRSPRGSPSAPAELRCGLAPPAGGSRLRAGEAASAVLLHSTACGLASSPLSQPLEVRRTRTVLRDEVAGGTVVPPARARL